MVTGIDRFREYSAAHEDQYAIMGGAACDQLCGSLGGVTIIDQAAPDNSLDPTELGVPFSRDDAVDILREV